ncbi:phenylalanine--tRNA ligase subunit beta [Deltaproteobacteria bacterium Smac51]|nr:phenylalanine--tRNA ligase subunit beta [Deltaproteobacteria bacterium Smac51]
MKASINWLEDYIDLSGLSPREVADKLTMAGLEVENLSDRFAHLNQVVSARLEKVEPMPKSDHLNICQVNAGSFGHFQVVCGAPNARVGLVAPLALVGVTLPSGLTIESTKLRGHDSYGMLCSEVELGLGGASGGIIELDNVEPGRTMKDVTGREDWVMEIGITPNRPDGLSIIGLARDLSALLNRPMKTVDYKLEETGPDVNTLGQVTIEAPEHANRYVARVITGLKIGPSPQWMVDRLAAVGIRSISNVVDVTNYVMIEMGLPLHAFDLDTVAGHHIIVKTYPKGVHFTTLDGQDRELKADVNLMICDGEKAVGLAGIMGGLNSEIESTTTNILLEGAYFNATTIRKASRALGLSTDASYRFERGCDPEICPRAVDRAIALMAELAGGSVAKGRIDCYPKPFKPTIVSFSPEKCNAYLGTEHRPEDMVRVLTAIGLKVEKAADGALSATLPSWRPDLSREVDVWEEVARLLDFDQLPATLPAPPVKRQSPPPAWTLREATRAHLAAQGFSESITYSFINRNFADKLGLSDDSPIRQRILPLLNPLSEEQGVLRPLLAPSLLTALRLNQNQGQKEVAMFELGAVFLSNGLDRQPDEKQTIGGLWAGFTGSGNWIEPARAVDFWDVKGVVESLAENLNLNISFCRGEELPVWYNPAEAALIKLEDGRLLGHLGRLNKKAAKGFGLKEVFGPVYLFELDGQEILKTGFSRKPFQGWSKFPQADRDMALVLDKDVPASRVIETIKEDGAIPLTDVLLFDLYEGDQLPEGKKSLAFRLTFQTAEKTLTDDEVNEFFQTITSRLDQKLGAALRS